MTLWMMHDASLGSYRRRIAAYKPLYRRTTTGADLGFLEEGDFRNPNEASEHWRGLGLRENDIWAFAS